MHFSQGRDFLNPNTKSFVDLSKRIQLQKDVSESKTDLQMLEAFLRGEKLQDQLPLTPQALEYFRHENAEYLSRLESSLNVAQKAKRMVQQKTNQLQRTTRGAPDAKISKNKVEELYQKEAERRNRIEDLRRRLDADQEDSYSSADEQSKKKAEGYVGVEAKKRALAEKILSLQVEKGKNQSNTIVERVFESKYKQEVLQTRTGQEVVLQSALKERKRREAEKPADRSLIRKAKLSPSRGVSNKSTNVTESKINQSEISKSRILTMSVLEREASSPSLNKENKSLNKSVTKRKKAADGKTVYVNYKGQKPPVVPTVVAADEARKKKEEAEAERRLLAEAAEQKARQEAEALALRAQREAEEAEKAAFEADNYDYADEKKKLEMILRQRELENQRLMVEESARRKRERNYLEEFLVSQSKKLPSINPDDPVLAKKIAQRAKIDIPGKAIEFDPNEQRPKYFKKGVDTKGQPLSNFKHLENPFMESSIQGFQAKKKLSQSQLTEDTNEIENEYRRFLGLPEVGRREPMFERYRPQAADEEPENPADELNSAEIEAKKQEEALLKPSLAPVSNNPFKARDAKANPPAKSPPPKPVANLKPLKMAAVVPIVPYEMEAHISAAGDAQPQIPQKSGNELKVPSLNNQGASQSKHVHSPENSKAKHIENISRIMSKGNESIEDLDMFDDDEESLDWKGINPHDLTNRLNKKTENDAMSQVDIGELQLRDLKKQQTIGVDEPIRDSVKTPRKLPEDLQSLEGSQNTGSSKAKSEKKTEFDPASKPKNASVSANHQATSNQNEPAGKAASVKQEQIVNQLPQEPKMDETAGAPPVPAKVESKPPSTAKTAPPLISAQSVQLEAVDRFSQHYETSIAQIAPVLPTAEPLSQASPQEELAPAQ